MMGPSFRESHEAGRLTAGDRPRPKWFNTINLRCSLLVNVTFPSFMRGQNR
jgi:hypothetical protein